MDDNDIAKIVLENALEHDGKASESAVFSKIAGMDRSLLSDIESTKTRVKRIVLEINKKSLEELEKSAVEAGLSTEKKKAVKQTGIKELPNVKGEVVLRLPPEPSGFMHLGHAIAGMINYIYKEKYGGELWLRFEDTNPNKVESRFVDSFREGYRWLNIKWDKEKFVSSDMDKMYEMGRKLIDDNAAYVCMCTPDSMKSNRLKGEECVHRKHTAEENRHLWDYAVDGDIKPGKAVVRFKGNMKDKDFSLRDPTIFRIIKTTYKPYNLWPIYDFASVVEDSICDITHILRSNEFKVSFQNELRNALGLTKPTIIQFSRFNFKGTPFSKRKLRELIKNGFIDGWDDIRLPTVSSIRRRGITPESIKQFALSVGYSQSKHEYDWDLLLTLNRRIIDSRAKRYFFVSDPYNIVVEGSAEKDVKIPFHPSADLGFRSVKTDGSFMIDGKDARTLKEGDLVRLKELYTVEIKGVENREIRAKFVSEKMEGGEKIIQWVTSDNVDVKVLMVGNILNPDGSFNEDSLKTVEGVAESGVNSLKEGEIIQFERFGFCILDKKDTKTFIYTSK